MEASAPLVHGTVRMFLKHTKNSSSHSSAFANDLAESEARKGGIQILETETQILELATPYALLKIAAYRLRQMHIGHPNLLAGYLHYRKNTKKFIPASLIP